MVSVKTFEDYYRELNSRQREAVDEIDGPVMVVAGPGTGKTQLLSMRVANILRQTDTAPNNILCLTFTESGAAAMRQRLLTLMGQDAYKVAIHTFHSFGTEIISNYPQFFYQGANFRPADELSSFEVLEPLFARLPHDNPLAKTMNGEFVALRDAQRAIANLKKAGLAPDELLKILDHNEGFIAHAEPLADAAFNVPRLSKKQLPDIRQLVSKLASFQEQPVPVALFKPLGHLCINELIAALEQAETADSTQPITKWRNRWFERNAQKEYVFKDRTRYQKLRALADIYHKYLLSMQEHSLFDFEDMILRVVHALEVFPELRFNLQEQYLYVLVDEFQDTNGAQLRLLQNLTDNEATNGRPNIMVVGDDDQAIYAFQGAEISNILQFRDLYRNPTVITLTDSYRSTAKILEASREVITQGDYRLETTIDTIDKTLKAHNQTKQTTSELHEFVNPPAQYQWLAQHINQLVNAGTPPTEIAVLGRNHRHLTALLPYLRQAGIRVNYERRNNVLESDHIVALVTLAQTVHALTEQQFDVVDALMPRLLSYDFWGLKTADIWRLSLAAHKEGRFWLELMLDRTDRLRAIAEFLIVTSQEAHHQPLELILDKLIGSNESQVADSEQAEVNGMRPDGPAEEFVSPFRAFYFNADRLEQQPANYISLLSNLAVLRQRLRDYRPDRPLFLKDFIDFIELHEKAGLAVVDTAEHRDDDQSIHLMTAHKAKGLEFDAVFVIDCQEDVWGARARTRHSSLPFPHNVTIEPAGQTADDCLRLFFVAMTRARQQLFLTCYQTDSTGKEAMPASFLQREMFEPITHEATELPVAPAVLEPGWEQRHLQLNGADKQTLLAPRLENYQLSSTHLTNFLDITIGGPQAFLLQNLLRFPQAMSRSAVFGSVIHTVLQRAHVHLTHTNERRPVEDILQDFELQLQNARLDEHDFTYLFEKGSAVLQTFFAKRYDSFEPTQKTEYSFKNQGVLVGEARLTGTIDLLEVNQTAHTVTVIDYKTSKPPKSWQGSGDYEKIKLHKYRQQLMMYKLLVEHSRDFGDAFSVDRGILEFVEPDDNGTIQRLELVFDRAELERFTQLIHAVWRHIMTLDFPPVNTYSHTYKGVLAFEDDLLKG